MTRQLLALSRAITVTAVMAIALHPLAATAQDAGGDTARARARFAEGLRYYDGGDWARALDAFRAAYTARPHPSVLVNIANCYVRLGRPTQAVPNFVRYLSESGDAVEAARRTEIEQALAEARASIARLSITATPEGQMVFVDGEQAGRAPLAQPIEVDPGPHVVELRGDSGATATVRITVTPGELANVRVAGASVAAALPTPGPVPATSAAATPVRATGDTRTPWRPPGSEEAPEPPRVTPGQAAAAASADSSEPTEPPASAPPRQESGLLDRVPTASWIAGGAGIVLVAVGAGFGVAALSSQSDFDDAAAAIEAGDYSSSAELESLQARGRRASDAQTRDAVISDVSLGLGIAALATAVALVVVSPNTPSEEQAAVSVGPRRHRSRSHVSATPLHGGGLLGIRGEF
ncbi:MAG: PEGA domain-containing protein [Deltaproteobacteria bacterium]|nr:PEGA domain-containing protein [Deltaproteobacteria bacterium]